MRCGIAAAIFALLTLGNPAAGQQITSPGANVFLTSFILATNYGVSTGGTGASNLANLLSALTAGCAINGATVVQLPPGTFTVDGILWPANCRNLTLKGSGNAYSYGDPANSSTVIKIGKPLSSGYGIKVPSSGAQPVFIEDVTIDCNGAPYGIRAFGQTLLRRVRVIHCTSAGIRGNGLNQARFQEVSSRDNSGDGLLIDQDPDASGIPSTIYHIEDSEFRQNGGNGLTIRSANNAAFENIVSEGNRGFGLDVNWQAEPVTQTRFDNLWLEHNALNGSSVYYLRITSANIAGGSNSWAQALVFRNLKINNVGGGVKSINVQAVLGLTIADASFPQDATGIIDLDTTNAQHIVFDKRTGGTLNTTGVRSYETRQITSGSVGGQALLGLGSGTNTTNVQQLLSGGNPKLVLQGTEAGATRFTLQEATGVFSIQDGTPTDLVKITNNGGMQLGSPTGGDKGIGTFSFASGLYSNGTLVIDNAQGHVNTKGISATATAARNLRGSCTFAAATTCTVTFGSAEPNTLYLIALGCNANKTFWWSSKGTGGFTVNAAVPSSDTCDWMLIR